MYWNSSETLLEVSIVRWIVTLDVLKYSFEEKDGEYIELNSNIRCIEIYIFDCIFYTHMSWIVTLDVLKYLWLNG